MTYKKAALFLLLPLMIGCDTTDSDPRMEEEENPQSEFITYSPPANNRATLVSSLPVVDAPQDKVYIRDLWGFEIDTKKYIATGSAIESENGLTDYTLHIINISDPQNPVQTSMIEGINAQDIKFWDHYLYTVNGHNDEEGGQIIDVSDPSNPVLSGNFESAHNIFIDQNGLLYLADASTRIYNLDNPENPELVTTFGNISSHDITVEGGKLYTFNGKDEPNISIYDISPEGTATLVTNYSSDDIYYSHSGWPSSDGKYLIVADEYAINNEADFTIWDLSENSPVLLNGFVDPNATAHNVMVRGDLAYVSYYTAGFRIFDITDPENPVLIGEVDTSPYEGDTVVERSSNGQGSFSISIVVRGAWGVFSKFDDGYAYISDVNTGLHIIKID